MSLRDVSDHVTQVQLEHPQGKYPVSVNVYLLSVDEGHQIMIDSGFRSTSDDLINLLKAEGVREITDLIITHAHPDHTGGMESVQRVFGARAHVHERELLGLRSIGSFLDAGAEGIISPVLSNHIRRTEFDEIKAMILGYVRIMPETIYLISGHRRDLGCLTLLHTPGHTPGHTAVFDKRDKVLISGDLILADDTSNVAFYPIQGYDPLLSYLESMRVVEGLGSRCVYTSHGDPITNLSERIDQQFLHHQRRLLEAIGSLQPRGTLIDVVRNISWSKGRFDELSAIDKWLAISEAISHVIFLENRGLIVRSSGSPLVYERRADENRVREVMRAIRRGSSVT
ncbi:MAG: MBL fold metallo-hydrolase [Aigarchaeota archaeon]|nr:MBL fold metallo-hydrolase [Aigarchaeota archaeon]MDW8092132.1 MBL fold metallo-hydrolase [Nitrososphaerota archaeon]